MAEGQNYDALVPPESEGERLDVFAAEVAGVTRSRAGALIREGRVTVDDAAQGKSTRNIKTLFETTLEQLGIEHKLIKPYTPKENGRVERSHRKDLLPLCLRALSPHADTRRGNRQVVQHRQKIMVTSVERIGPQTYFEKQ